MDYLDVIDMVKIREEHVNQIRKEISELLTDEVSYSILKSSIEGLRATTKNASNFNITPRKYYRRLARLLKMGLIEKNERLYKITLLGGKVLKFYQNFTDLMASSHKLRLIDKIKKIEDVSPFDLQAIKLALGATKSEEMTELKFITSYDDLVNGINYMIDSAQETLMMATRYMDLRVTEHIAGAVKRGVKCYFITEEKNSLVSRVKIQTSLLPNMDKVRAFAEMAKSPNFNVRYKDLLYSFVVSDDRYVGIEFVDQSKPEDFSFGFGIESEKLAGILRKNFEAMWNVAKETTLEIPSRT